MQSFLIRSLVDGAANSGSEPIFPKFCSATNVCILGPERQTFGIEGGYPQIGLQVAARSYHSLRTISLYGPRSCSVTVSSTSSRLRQNQP